MHDLDTLNADDRFKLTEYCLQCKPKRKKELSAPAGDGALIRLLRTTNFATLVKERSLVLSR